MRLEDAMGAMGAMGQMTSYAADWSPDLATPRGIQWPIDLTTGKLRPAVWARRFSEQLSAAGVANTFSADDDGHMCPSDRARGIAEFLSRARSAASP